MKINFDAMILDPKGAPLNEGGEGGTMTLGKVIMTAMFAQLPDDQNADGSAKVKQFKIAMTANNGGEGDLKTEDVVLIKKRVAKLYGALVVGRVYELIEGELDDESDAHVGNGAEPPTRPQRPGPGPRPRV